MRNTRASIRRHRRLQLVARTVKAMRISFSAWGRGSADSRRRHRHQARVRYLQTPRIGHWGRQMPPHSRNCTAHPPPRHPTESAVSFPTLRPRPHTRLAACLLFRFSGTGSQTCPTILAWRLKTREMPMAHGECIIRLYDLSNGDASVFSVNEPRPALLLFPSSLFVEYLLTALRVGSIMNQSI